MELQGEREHFNCLNYDHSDKPAIEVIHYEQGDEREFVAFTNGIVCFMDGQACYEFKNYPSYEMSKGDVIFIPVGTLISYRILERSTVVVFRLYNRIKLCECFLIERLFGTKTVDFVERISEKKIYSLTANCRLQALLEGVVDCLNDGIRCKHYFELKIRELFLLIRTYYSKEQIHDFLLLILSIDTAFSEYVKQNWHKYNTVIELAESMNQTPKQFSKKFKEVFGKPAYKWMKENKALSIYNEIISCNKPLKQIAFDFGFYTMAQFTKFCKAELGRPPSIIRLDPSNLAITNPENKDVMLTQKNN